MDSAASWLSRILANDGPETSTAAALGHFETEQVLNAYPKLHLWLLMALKIDSGSLAPLQWGIAHYALPVLEKACS